MAPKRARSPTSEAGRAAACASKAREKAEHTAAVAERKVERAAKREEAARAKVACAADKEKRDDERARSIVEKYLDELVMTVARDIIRERRERRS